MRLSTAIREGSKGREQGFGANFNSYTGAVCAIGAARIGAGYDPVWTRKFSSHSIFPDITAIIETEDGDESIASLIFHFNDRERWSFDEIADWLEYYGY